MTWLFWILLIFVMIFVIQGFSRGLIRTAVSMFSIIIVMAATAWLNPYISDYIREKTDWQERLEDRCEALLQEKIGEKLEESINSQVSFIDELPIPENIKRKLAENNNGETYQQMAVDNFTEYLSKYIAAGIMNGITFLIAFVLVMIVIKVVLYAVDLLTELPVIGGCNRVGGALAGLLQGILWIWVIFLGITLFYDTQVGRYLMETIQEDPVLRWIYDRNYLVQILMGITFSSGII